METTTSTSAPKRTRRTAEQWHAILTAHLAADETPQQLAHRLNVSISTVETQLRRITDPCPRRERAAKFVEIDAKASSPPRALAGAVRFQTSTGVMVTFETLPPPEYLAAALGLGG